MAGLHEEWNYNVTESKGWVFVQNCSNIIRDKVLCLEKFPFQVAS